MGFLYDWYGPAPVPWEECSILVRVEMSRDRTRDDDLLYFENGYRVRATYGNEFVVGKSYLLVSTTALSAGIRKDPVICEKK